MDALKYTLRFKLNADVSLDQRERTKEKLLRHLGISRYELSNWIMLPYDSLEDIPEEMVEKMATFFNCSIDDLINYQLIIKHVA